MSEEKNQQEQEGQSQTGGEQNGEQNANIEQGGEQNQQNNLIEGAQGAGKGRIPEKFHVKKEDGTLDDAATLEKFIGSYGELEKRIGSGDAPPKDETGYKLDYSKMPEGVNIDPERERAFLKRMHGAGLTNKQVQSVMDQFGEVLAEGMGVQQGQAKAVLAEARKELSVSWGDGETFERQAQLARDAFNQFADEEDKKSTAAIGRDLKTTYKFTMKLLAKLGADMREDNPAQGGGSETAQSLEEMRKSEAYLNKNHPDHKTTVERVKKLYEKKYPAKK